VARFRRDHPDVHVELGLADPDDPLAELRRGGADLALVVRPGAGEGDDMLFEHLVDDPYRAVLPKGYRLATKRVIDLADLADEPWVGNEWPTGPCLRIVLDACGAAGFTPDFVVESEDCTTAQGFVAAGLGISLMPVMGIRTRHPDVAVRRVRSPEPVRSVHAAVRRSHTAGPALRAMLEALRGAASR
jgi:DNA-binding transcriptional LysR family regulator